MQPPYAQPPFQAPPTAPPIRICPSCGVIAPAQRNDCNLCKAPFGPQPVFAPGRAGNAVFAAITICDFQCRSCGLRSPLPTIDADGDVECLRCGLNQAFDVEQWKEAVKHAHEVADLSGPLPEGQNPIPGTSIAGKNPHARVGHDHTASTYEQSATIISGGNVRSHTLRSRVSPGHPLCARCKVPLNAAIDGRGGVMTACQRCGDRATYTMPPAAAALSPSLRGIVSEELRADRPPAKIVTAQAGVEAIACPQCGAALQLASGEIATCAYCKTTARVPRRMRNPQKGGEPPFTPYWLLFEGPSPERMKLVSGRSGDDDDDDDDFDDSDAHQKSALAIQQQVAKTSQNIQLFVGITVGVVLILTAIGVGVSLWMSSTSSPTPQRPPPARRSH